MRSRDCQSLRAGSRSPGVPRSKMPSPPSSPPRQQTQKSTAQAPYRLTPQPIETTTKSNRPSVTKDNPPDGLPTQRRLGTQFEESLSKNTKKVRTGPWQSPNVLASPLKQETPPQLLIGKTSSVLAKSTRFAPQLIETTRRSRKSGDTTPALLPTDKTDLSPGDQVHVPRHLRLARPSLLPGPPDNTPVASSEEVPRIPESRFSSSNLSRKAPRRQSFRVPTLAPIESRPDSEESTNSNCPSLSTSPSAGSDETEPYKHATRIRESCDDRYSGYLLALAARAAEKQLREQAMAAYPNENFHEQVDHFAIDRDSDGSDEEGIGLLSQASDDGDAQTSRRESAAGWNLMEMRAHQENLERQQKQHAALEHNQHARRPSIKLPACNCGEAIKDPEVVSDKTGAEQNAISGWRKGVEVDHMRTAASPPMLGGHLQFPKCQSPLQTRIEADQYPSHRKISGASTPRDHSGLWTPTDTASRQNSATGLWHGVCYLSDRDNITASKLLQTGLMTPQVEREDPFTKVNLSGKQQMPSSPTNSSNEPKLGRLDDVLLLEQKIESEFHDGFVTQIYNYLSIGYPSLGRKYDQELSKISKISIEELRQDDARKNTKGYVGAPEGTGSDMASMQDGHCARWMALRLYIREWARQQPRMVEPEMGANNDWGVRARRGSWAI